MPIDLRSDTVTRPSAEMRAAMAGAEVGDDVFGDDPTVCRLEEHLASMLGKEAAVFVTSGTQSNLCALLAHCGRGDEYLAGDRSHTYMWEGGGGAVLGGIQPQTVSMLADGLPDPAELRRAVKPDDHHFARSRLVCLENTNDGSAQSAARMREATVVAREHGLATHLDGARLWNAAVALDEDLAVLAADFDSVSLCLSKGLGAPAGSVLVGSAAVVAEARKWRKMLGGGLRQVGVLAAAGLYAVEHNIERLAVDHARAAELAARLATIDGVAVHKHATNMVFVEIAEASGAFEAALLDNGVLARASAPLCRFVVHLDVVDGDVDRVVAAVERALAAVRS